MHLNNLNAPVLNVLNCGGNLKSRKNNFVPYVIKVGLGLSNFRKSKIKSEESFHLPLKKMHYVVGWTHVAQDGSGNNANESMGSYGDSSLETLFLTSLRETDKEIG